MTIGRTKRLALSHLSPISTGQINFTCVEGYRVRVRIFIRKTGFGEYLHILEFSASEHWVSFSRERLAITDGYF